MPAEYPLCVHLCAFGNEVLHDGIRHIRAILIGDIQAACHCDVHIMLRHGGCQMTENRLNHRQLDTLLRQQRACDMTVRVRSYVFRFRERRFVSQHMALVIGLYVPPYRVVVVVCVWLAVIPDEHEVPCVDCLAVLFDGDQPRLRVVLMLPQLLAQRLHMWLRYWYQS